MLSKILTRTNKDMKTLCELSLLHSLPNYENVSRIILETTDNLHVNYKTLPRNAHSITNNGRYSTWIIRCSNQCSCQFDGWSFNACNLWTVGPLFSNFVCRWTHGSHRA